MWQDLCSAYHAANEQEAAAYPVAVYASMKHCMVFIANSKYTSVWHRQPPAAIDEHFAGSSWCLNECTMAGANLPICLGNDPGLVER